MRTVVDCVSSFIPLLSTEYEIVLGRKNVAVKLIITFDKKDCFHLMGLQYLTDRPELRRDRGKIFDEIQKGIIKCILQSPADSDAFQSGRCAKHNGRPETMYF